MFKKRKIILAELEAEREYQVLIDTLNSKDNLLDLYETGSMSELGCEIFGRKVNSCLPNLELLDCIQIRIGDYMPAGTYFYRLMSKKLTSNKPVEKLLK